MARTGNRVKLTTELSDQMTCFIFALGMFLLLGMERPSINFGWFISLLSVSTGLYLWISARLLAGKSAPITLRNLFFIGLALRLWAVFGVPDFSQDIYRYIYEGKVVWHMGLDFPFVVPPSEAQSHGIPAHLIDFTFSKINHPSIPTVYPPAAQIVFIFSGGISEGLRTFGVLLGPRFDLLVLKSLLVMFEMATYLIIGFAIRSYNTRIEKPRRINEAWMAILVACPLPIIEIAREGHADSIAMFGLALGIAGFITQRFLLGHMGWVWAALAKLNGLLGLVVGIRATRKRVLIALAVLVLAGLPYALLSADSGRGLSEYAQRWRAFDGVFSILLYCAEVLIGGDYIQVLDHTITRHQAARVMCLGLFGLYVLIRLRSSIEPQDVPSVTGELLLVLLLVSPTLHPWYTTWLLPFLPFALRARSAILWLLCVTPLTHHATHLLASEGQWDDPTWLRLFIHIPSWLFLMLGYRQSRATQRHTSDRLQA